MFINPVDFRRRMCEPLGGNDARRIELYERAWKSPTSSVSDKKVHNTGTVNYNTSRPFRKVNFTKLSAT